LRPRFISQTYPGAMRKNWALWAEINKYE
jgi:hypothetical protein